MIDPLEGIITAMNTPLTAEGELDADGLRRLYRFQFDNGVRAALAMGFNGEVYSLPNDVRQQAITESLRVAESLRSEDREFQLAVCVNGDSAHETLENVRLVEDTGQVIDGIVVQLSRFTSGSPLDLLKEMRGLTSAPIYAYENQQTVQQDKMLTPSLLHYLAHYRPRLLVGAKLTVDLDVFNDFKAQDYPRGFSLYPGNAMCMFPILEDDLESPIKGVVSGPANCFPAEWVEAYHQLRGEYSAEKYRRLFQSFEDIVAEHGVGHVPVMKAFLAHRGIIEPHCHPNTLQLEARDIRRVGQQVDDLYKKFIDGSQVPVLSEF